MKMIQRRHVNIPASTRKLSSNGMKVLAEKRSIFIVPEQKKLSARTIKIIS